MLVLRALNQEHCQGADNSGTIIDYQLPGSGVLVRGTRGRPQEDDENGDEDTQGEPIYPAVWCANCERILAGRFLEAGRE
jgi:hypothetical protein